MTIKQKQNIYLIGPMGAGKSSVGKYLARQLNMEFYDTDEEIEKNTGVDLGWIFDVEGEAGFRQRETMVLESLTHLSGIVLATGGGTVITDINRDLLQQHGCVVYLTVSLDYQLHRTVNDSRRPLLRVTNREEVLKRLHLERLPLYQSIADFEVLTDERSVALVGNAIIEWYKSL